MEIILGKKNKKTFGHLLTCDFRFGRRNTLQLITIGIFNGRSYHDTEMNTVVFSSRKAVLELLECGSSCGWIL